MHYIAFARRKPRPSLPPCPPRLSGPYRACRRRPCGSGRFHATQPSRRRRDREPARSFYGPKVKIRLTKTSTLPVASQGLEGHRTRKRAARGRKARIRLPPGHPGALTVDCREHNMFLGPECPGATRRRPAPIPPSLGNSGRKSPPVRAGTSSPANFYRPYALLPGGPPRGPSPACGAGGGREPP